MLYEISESIANGINDSLTGRVQFAFQEDDETWTHDSELWSYVPSNFQASVSYYLETLGYDGYDSFLESISEKPGQLRVAEHVPGLGLFEYDKAKVLDFSTIGLIKVSPKYDRGRKISAAYICPTFGWVAVEKTFSDVIGERVLADGSKANGIVGIQVRFDWYDTNGNIACTKTEVVKNLNIAEEETMMRNRRYRSLDWLKSSAKGTAAMPLVDALFDHYSEEILLFREQGRSDLKDSIDVEVNPTILWMLGVVVTQTGGTIRDSILYQVS